MRSGGILVPSNANPLARIRDPGSGFGIGIESGSQVNPLQTRELRFRELRAPRNFDYVVSPW
jgi:hypothetical protein